MKGFYKWIAEGNAIKIGEDKWLEQTAQYRKTFSLKGLKEFYKKEYLTQI